MKSSFFLSLDIALKTTEVNQTNVFRGNWKKGAHRVAPQCFFGLILWSRWHYQSSSRMWNFLPYPLGHEKTLLTFLEALEADSNWNPSRSRISVIALVNDLHLSAQDGVGFHIPFTNIYIFLSLCFSFFPPHSLSSIQIVIQEPRSNLCLASGLSHGLRLPPILRHGLGNLFIFRVLEIDLMSCQGLAWVLQKEHWQIFMEPKVKLKTLLK